MTPRILSRVRCAEASQRTYIICLAVAWAGVKQRMSLRIYKHFVDLAT